MPVRADVGPEFGDESGYAPLVVLFWGREGNDVVLGTGFGGTVIVLLLLEIVVLLEVVLDSEDEGEVMEGMIAVDPVLISEDKESTVSVEMTKAG